MYYNSYPHYIYPNHYPMQSMPHYAARPLPRQLAMRPNGTSGSSFPPVNTRQLETSVGQMQKMVQQIELLLNKIGNSEQFARNLMNEAQRSNKVAVDQLVKSVGITLQFETTYTPDGIRIKFIDPNCCSLTLLLDW